MKSAIKMLKISEGGAHECVMVHDDLHELKQHIDCDFVDMPTRYVEGKPFVFICDDCGLLRGRAATCAGPAINGYPVRIAGTVLITKSDAHGENFLDLTDADVDLVVSHIWVYYGREILFDVCYRDENP